MGRRLSRVRKRFCGKNKIAAGLSVVVEVGKYRLLNIGILVKRLFILNIRRTRL